MKLRVRPMFEPRDLWVGIYWTNTWDFPEGEWRAFDLYLCILPMLPIRFTLYRPEQSKEVER